MFFLMLFKTVKRVILIEITEQTRKNVNMPLHAQWPVVTFLKINNSYLTGMKHCIVEWHRRVGSGERFILSISDFSVVHREWLFFSPLL